jgi:hypothetical protein
MASTTNYGWSTPDDTSLVKDGASAIRTLGSSIDTTTKALNPETTLGDISYRSATANTNTRLAIGTSGQVLAVNGSGVPAWTTISSGGMTSIASGSIAASATGIDISSISADYKNLYLVMRNWSMTSGGYIQFRLNNDSGSDYSSIRQYVYASTAYNGFQQGATSCELALLASAAQTGQALTLQISDYTNTSAFKLGSWYGTGSDNEMWQGSFVYRDTGAINRIQIISAASSFDLGTYELFGVK